MGFGGRLAFVFAFIAVAAIWLSLEVIADDGSVNNGGRCATKSSCNASQCTDPSLVCCDTRSFSMASNNEVRSSMNGTCTCCQKDHTCRAACASVRDDDNPKRNLDAYSQFCSKVN